MDLGINGRVALVMGASKGIGRGIAAVLAREGAKVAVASRSRERLDAVAEELSGDVTAFVVDASDLARLRELPAKLLGLPEEYGDLVAFLASDRAADVNGTTIPIDGGPLKSV